MSEPEPEPTPADHVVIGLRIEAALLPAWFAEVRAVSATRVRRMAVIERPEGWIVQCEVHRDQVEPFHAALAEAWERFEGRNAADGTGP